MLKLAFPLPAGEVKILGRLNKHWAQVGPQDTHLVVGDDADLVSIALFDFKNLSLFVHQWFTAPSRHALAQRDAGRKTRTWRSGVDK